ncbi:hypothetical protein F4820DRAFT_91377 [Hypoxylon rubiginosum]|uniref:Uncharacterized protein n=1 Tax=Hypoxylon rubiginosum TaxID=110542 RepID=A0ACB9YNQ4_9PEZI|nr:hypothetical protein F4820DRAFT_91377 [Hypoxylon rubiginosum]
MPLSSRFTKLKSLLRRGILPKPPAQQSRDEADDLSYASASVYSTATLAMIDVFDAQAGAPTAAEVVRFTADRMSSGLRSFASSIDTVAARVTFRYHMSDRVEFWRFESITSQLLRFANTNARSSAKYVAYRVNIYTSPQAEATMAAIAKAEIDIKRAVADVVMAYANTAKPTIESVRFIRKLLAAVTAAASQAANTVADVENFEDPDEAPPPYTP